MNTSGRCRPVPADQRLHRLVGLRPDGAARRPARHQPQGARSRWRPRTWARCRSQRLAEIAPACRISRARVVDAGRIITAGGIASGMELGFHLLRRAGYAERFIDDVARVMEYSEAYRLYKNDRDETARG